MSDRLIQTQLEEPAMRWRYEGFWDGLYHWEAIDPPDISGGERFVMPLFALGAGRAVGDIVEAGRLERVD